MPSTKIVQRGSTALQVGGWFILVEGTVPFGMERLS